MSVTFRVPLELLQAEQTEIFFILGLNWLSHSSDNEFEIIVNNQAVTCNQIQLDNSDDTVESYHVNVPIQLLKLRKEQENRLEVIVKSVQSPLMVSFFELKTSVLPEVAEASNQLKTMQTATFGGAMNLKELDENILDGENGQSMFDPNKQQLDSVASEELISSRVVSQPKTKKTKKVIAEEKGKISASDDDDAMENKREVD